MPEAPRRAAPGGLIRSTALRRLTLAMVVGSLLSRAPGGERVERFVPRALRTPEARFAPLARAGHGSARARMRGLSSRGAKLRGDLRIPERTP